MSPGRQFEAVNPCPACKHRGQDVLAVWDVVTVVRAIDFKPPPGPSGWIAPKLIGLVKCLADCALFGREVYADVRTTGTETSTAT